MLTLKLKNYRRFVEDQNAHDGFHQVDFGSGLTVVTGSNGAGKTTLVEALGYSLYGPKHGQKPDIIPDSAVGETEVICDLEIDEQIIRVQRWSDCAKL